MQSTTDKITSLPVDYERLPESTILCATFGVAMGALHLKGIRPFSRPLFRVGKHSITLGNLSAGFGLGGAALSLAAATRPAVSPERRSSLRQAQWGIPSSKATTDLSDAENVFREIKNKLIDLDNANKLRINPDSKNDFVAALSLLKQGHIQCIALGKCYEPFHLFFDVFLTKEDFRDSLKEWGATEYQAAVTYDKEEFRLAVPNGKTPLRRIRFSDVKHCSHKIDLTSSYVPLWFCDYLVSYSSIQGYNSENTGFYELFPNSFQQPYGQ